jgi:hypothetical protein
VIYLGLIIAVLNLPFGYWRANTVKLSWQWFVAIHLPVPLVIALRLWFGYSWSAVPFFVACFALGQWLGGRLHQTEWFHGSAPKSSCLVMDALRLLRTSPTK